MRTQKMLTRIFMAGLALTMLASSKPARMTPLYIMGPTDVNTGSSCALTYTAVSPDGPSGWTYEWDTNGEIVNSNGEYVQIHFSGPGEGKWISVDATRGEEHEWAYLELTASSSGMWCTN